MQQLGCLHAGKLCSRLFCALGMIPSSRRVQTATEQREHLHVEKRCGYPVGSHEVLVITNKQTHYLCSYRLATQAPQLFLMCSLSNYVRVSALDYPRVCCGTSPCHLGPPPRCKRGGRQDDVKRLK